MRPGRLKTGTGHIRGEWPVLLLFVAVLLPTGCVLWLMNRAIGNERLAVRQKLADTYRSQLALVRDRLDADWAARAAALNGITQITAGGLADSAILLDATGAPAYPAAARLPAADPNAADPEWIAAQRLEQNDPAAAAARYARLSGARAAQAAARCLIRANRREEAVRLVIERFARPGPDRAVDLQGRLIAADALLMAVEFLKPGDARLLPTARKLRELLVDYSDASMPAAQRLFLMKEMRSLKLPPELLDFPAFDAEDLAARLLEAEPKPRADMVLRLSAVPGIWKLGSQDGRAIGLFRTQTLLRQTRAFLSRRDLPADVRAEIALPGAPAAGNTTIETMPAGARMPGWQLTLVRVGADPFDDLAGKRMTLYLWIGSLMSAAVIAIALIAARGISRSLRLAGMRTDLVTTVSHELKTPLSSMRLLVDTLLDEPVFDPGRTREYLELISRENARLSQLIANFLAFSRMERNKYAFEFASVRVEEVVGAAVEAAGERFSDPGCSLKVEVAPGLPEIRADQGALVTALVNLLDNAYKYTPGEKRIALRAYADGDARVCLEVGDNGIGIAARDMKRIFRKFYQADRRLARTGGGCGLGLTIVRFLVEAHGGSVLVESEPGKGSTFTVALKGTA